MTEKEKQVQNALGTMKRQMFVQADGKDTMGLIEDFEKALENFGLFMYDNPDMDDSDEYAFIISNEQLTEEQVNALCEYDDDECKGCKYKKVSQLKLTPRQLKRAREKASENFKKLVPWSDSKR